MTVAVTKYGFYTRPLIGTAGALARTFAVKDPVRHRDLFYSPEPTVRRNAGEGARGHNMRLDPTTSEISTAIAGSLDSFKLNSRAARVQSR